MDADRRRTVETRRSAASNRSSHLGLLYIPLAATEKPLTILVNSPFDGQYTRLFYANLFKADGGQLFQPIGFQVRQAE